MAQIVDLKPGGEESAHCSGAMMELQGVVMDDLMAANPRQQIHDLSSETAACKWCRSFFDAEITSGDCLSITLHKTLITLIISNKLMAFCSVPPLDLVSWLQTSQIWPLLLQH